MSGETRKFNVRKFIELPTEHSKILAMGKHAKDDEVTVDSPHSTFHGESGIVTSNQDDTNVINDVKVESYPQPVGFLDTELSKK